jgi:hypothetical protein
VTSALEDAKPWRGGDAATCGVVWVSIWTAPRPSCHPPTKSGSPAHTLADSGITASPAQSSETPPQGQRRKK